MRRGSVRPKQIQKKFSSRAFFAFAPLHRNIRLALVSLQPKAAPAGGRASTERG
jgi:hypothetical protein